MPTLGSDGRLKDRTGIAPQGVAFSAYLSTGGSYGWQTWTKVLLDTIEYDSHGWFDATTNRRYQPKVPGYYHIEGTVRISSMGVSGDIYVVGILKNGAVYKEFQVDQVSNTFSIARGGSTLVYLNGTTDYVELALYNGATSNRALSTGRATTFMSGHLVGTSVGVMPEPWHYVGGAGEPAFTNSWTNWAGAGNQARFRKDPHGLVKVQGMLSPGTFGTSAFTLPVGYRPANDYRYAVNSANAFGITYINSSGNLIPYSGSTWTDLSPIIYAAEA